MVTCSHLVAKMIVDLYLIDRVNFIWHYLDIKVINNILITCSECVFSDSVVSIDWNKDGTLLASADMAGLIKIWNIKEKKAVMDLEEDELEFISFHPALDKKGHSYLLAAQTDGNCYFYSIKDGSFQERLISFSTVRIHGSVDL